MHRVLCLVAAAASTLAAPAGGTARPQLGAARAGRPAALDLVDHSRLIRLPGGKRVARPVTTDLWYPARGDGPWPLVVFGHGFGTTPATYRLLLQAWARAGCLVAAPVFPLTNADAPGGPTETDLVNQPRDLSFVISQLLAASADAHGPLHGLVDPRRVAIAGQSDGAMTAFASAYERRWQDPRVRAALVLSGAELGGSRQPLAVHQPPLLAVQGTADRINDPANTYLLYAAVHAHKFLLVLHGTGHLAPYAAPSRALAVVERVTIAFLDHYLAHAPLAELRRAAGSAGFAELTGR
ncbi:MAG TPA: hypothetical protein VFL60_03815 [Gaiellaceae bacterium]|nr:hypothetical protein [Gaiellaceae bacterium]